MKENKIILTDEISEHIRFIQTDLKYTDEQFSRALGLSVDQYKYIIKKKHAKYISKQVLSEIRSFTNNNYTEDYLYGKSNHPHKDKNGRLINSLEFSNAKYLKDIENFLQRSENSQFLKNLHFILFDLPHSVSTPIINSLNATAEMLYVNSPYGKEVLSDSLEKSLDKGDFKLLKETLTTYSRKCVEHTIIYSEARAYSCRKQYKTALKKYIRIIYFADLTTQSVAENAMQEIELFKKEWSKFPQDLLPLLDMFPTIKGSHFIEIPTRAKEIMEPYISEYL